MKDGNRHFETSSSPKKREKMKAVFYQSSAGNEPVRKWLKDDLSDTDSKQIGRKITKVQYRFPIGMPICRPMGDGLYEVRCDLENSTARVFFCIKDDQIVLLHGFIKKTEETPDEEIKLARKRKREVDNE